LVEIQAYQCSNIISYLLKLAWQLLWQMTAPNTSFDHVIEIACVWTITLLYIYLYIWGLDLRLNNINYSCWYYSSSIIITFLYWTSETPLSSSITTSKYHICDILNFLLIFSSLFFCFYYYIINKTHYFSSVNQVLHDFI